MTSCAVVVPVRDAGDDLIELLESLARDGSGALGEVILSDDGSTDGAVERCQERSWPFPVRVVRHDVGTGAGAARNRGVAATDAELLVFIDADDVAAPGFVDAIVSPLLGGSADLVAAARDFDTLNEGLDAAAAALRGSASSPSEIEPGAGWLVSGASGMAIRRSLFDFLGGFDERLRRREDHDLWLRAQYAGHPVAFVADALVLVRRRSTATDQLAQARAGSEWSAVFFAMHPRLTGAAARWRRSVGPRWLVPRVPYLLLPSRRMVFRGGLARWMGWREGQRRVRIMRRRGQLGSWQASRPGT